jgi:GNAT superfamily N-acetyltransferase
VRAVRSLSELDYRLWRSIARLYAQDPLTHAYLLYDLVYEPDRTDAWFEVNEGEVAGYALVWRGPREAGVHLWGRLEDPAAYVPGLESIIMVHSEGLLGPLLASLKGRGSARVEWYLDMVADESTFRPIGAERAVRLNARDEQHVESFLRLSRARGLSLSAEEARGLLARRRYYGVFEGEELVSVACAYLRLPEVWIVGDVYTLPEHRGKGHAKTVTSAVTRDAVASGARALLHVSEANEPALRVYSALGYRAASRKPWVFFNPSRSGLHGLTAL